MAAIRLAKLPDRTAIKLTISMLPDLHQRLSEYAYFYRQTYEAEEPVGDLVPAMLAAFLSSDRSFVRSRPAGSGRKSSS
jgi:hypothetical protein